MKKIWIIVLVLMLATFTFTFSQEIHWTNQATVLWDASTLPGGGAVPAEDVITYRIWQRVNGIETMITEVSGLEYTFTFADEGIYTAGIQGVRYPANGDPPDMSEINWSDTNGEYTPSPFLLGFSKGVDAPKNLRIQ